MVCAGPGGSRKRCTYTGKNTDRNPPELSHKTRKKRDDIPYEQAIKYCEEKNVDLNWILNIKEN